MRDWEAYVRTHLPPSALGQARESRIVRELASQIEECYRDALARGLSDSEAARRRLSYRVLRWPYGENDRAQIEHATSGPIKRS